MGKLPTLRPVLPQPLGQGVQLPSLQYGGPSAPFVWRFIKRYTINPAASASPIIPLPPQGMHAKVYWSARDTSASTTASFATLQVGINGGAIDTAANYNWTDISNSNGGAPAGAGLNPDTRWAAFVTTGGGIGPQFRSNGRIYLEEYSDPTQQVKAWWDTIQVNSGTVLRRSGAGYYNGTLGALTSLLFSATSGILVAGTFFELWVAMPAV